MKLKPRKCAFSRREVEYLGYVVSVDGISADKKKVKAVQEFPQPRDVKSLRSFLGLASYYRSRFIPKFSSVAGPLYPLTKKDAVYEWDKGCQEAFEKLKQLLTEAPVLAFPDFSREFILETDTSGAGLGAVLAQKGEDGASRPIAHASRTIQPHERNYGVTELEALAIVWSVKHFRHYLYGHRCEVFTDHEALKSLLNTPHPSGKLARWGLAIQELDLHIHYRPGKKNMDADALSHSPFPIPAVEDESMEDVSQMMVAAVQMEEPMLKDGEDSLGKSQRDDPGLAEIIHYLESNELPEDDQKARRLMLSHDQYEMLDGALY